jgi:alkylation response protein AidB-like acyl-CoA dehydrogenase
MTLTDPAPEAKEIRDACRALLRDLSPPEVVRRAGGDAPFDEVLWRRVLEAGWTGVGLPESVGGAGLGVVAQAVMFAEVGRALAPVPLLGAGMATAVLAAAGAKELADVLDGTVLATLVVGRGLSPLGTARVRVTTAGGEVRLDGTASAVVDGAGAGLFVVVAAGDDGPVVCLLDRDAPGLEVTVVPSTDVSRPLADLRLTQCVGRALPLDLPALRDALAVAATSYGAEVVGAADRAFEMTVDYLKTRHQFGRPIGSQQALKHRCAELATDLTLARELVFAGAAALDRGSPDPARDALVAAALHRASSVLSRIGAEAVQMHGAIGFTEEHDIGLYYRRALTVAAALPGPVAQQELLADLLGA